MRIAEYVRQKIAQAVGVELEKVNLEHPDVESFGDYSSNIAMVLAKELKRNPRELAQEIADNLQSSLDSINELIVSLGKK